MKQALLTLFMLASFYVQAQREADNWVFGNHAGLVFNGQMSEPTHNSRLHQLEGSAIISDRNSGQMLFYTNGISIWNCKHEIMPNGLGLSGSATSTQSALIVPAPGEVNRYYVFTVKAANDGTNPGLHYSLVDLNLNQGFGDVVAGVKNKLIESKTTEKLTAIPHSNGIDYWVLAHAWESNEFLIMLLTAKGVSQIQRSAIGTVHKASQRINNSEAMGYLRASPDGTLVASAVYGLNRPFELYDFDAQTGLLSNYRSLGNFSHQYGVSFSPDNTKLYLSGLYTHNGSYQFDLSTPNNAMTELTLTDTLRGKPVSLSLGGALQLGIDGKLYAALGSPIRSRSGNTKITVVNKPNESGEDCKVGFMSMEFRGKAPLLGLPNFIQSIFNERKKPLDAPTKELINVYPNPVVTNTLTIEPSQVDQPIEGFSVYDPSGREIFHSNQWLTSKVTLDTSTWKSGMIYQVVFHHNNQPITKKILKQ
ncbi:T9SS type A sorting domain-containing protein [Larkinella rosea]|nr:T9SS type A sorting domain-containing protein [Larkinella rosea]